jgi:hypothetical protein
MNRFAILVGIFLANHVHGAAVDSPVRTTVSSSGQFVVRGPAANPNAREFSAVEPTASTNSAIVELDPNLLAISCERIKQSLLRELSLGDLWRARIFVVINSSMPSNQPPVIGVKLFADGWQYQVEVPTYIDKLKLVRGMVQVMLMEIANRYAVLRSAEIPLWLSEGLSHQIAESAQGDLVFSTPKWTVNNVTLSTQNRQGVRRDPLKDARERLSTHAAFTFTKMGDPLPEQLPEETWKTYQACSQLFVSQLLALNGGRAAMLRMLTLLPHYLNWQSAFLAAFQNIFPRLLDVEKWWAIVLVNFTGLDPLNAWSREIAVQKLDDALRPTVLVSSTAGSLPKRTRMSVQEIINQWDYLKQRIELKQITSQLVILRVKMPVEMVGLIEEYRGTIESYVSQRDQSGMPRGLPGMAPLQADRLVRNTVKRLNDLDQKRAAFGQPAADAARTKK